MRWFIGDIQGCLVEFQALLSHPEIRPGDEWVLLGDIINRGPRSLEVVNLVRNRETEIQMILGNHEVGLLHSSIHLA